MTTAIARRLGLRKNSRLRLINAPDRYRKRLVPLPDGAKLIHKGHELADVVHIFARSVSELRDLVPDALRLSEPGGSFWVSFPKKGSGVKTDLTRDTSWEIMSELRMHPVAQIAIDNAWSAIRFRRDETGGR
jgi:hypothetical protein